MIKQQIENKSLKDFIPSQSELENLLQNYQNGRYFETEKLANYIIQKFPQHPFAWKVLGALFKNTGKIKESLFAFQKVITLSPEDASSYLNLGIIFKELIRLDDAVESYRQAIALKPNYAHAHNNLGNILEELGRLDDAVASYKQAIVSNPGFAEAHNNLGVTLEKLNKLYDAEASYNKAILLKPSYVEAYNNLGCTLEKLGKLDDAESNYRQAIALKSNYSEGHNNLGNFLRLQRKYEEAIHHFDLLNNDFGTALSLECLYLCKNYVEFYKRLKTLSVLDNKNLRVAAVSSFAAHQLKKKDPYPFCKNPLDFIEITNLADNDFYSNALIDEIIKEAEGYQLTWETRTTKFGFQGQANVFEKPSKPISLLAKIIQQAINAYYNKFKSESNLFIKSWPKKHKLNGWYNRLVKNGHHTSHIHQTGWLSGVIYLKTINLPKNNEGAIEFSLHGYDLPITDEKYPRKIYRPKRGDIILFPSSLFHRTIPFTIDSERCVIAFDLKSV